MTRTIREMQQSLPRGLHEYSAEFVARSAPHRDADYALLHIFKALGKLAGVFNDPKKGPPDRFVADLLYCSMRIANVWPGHPFDLTDQMNWAMDSVGAICEHSEPAFVMRTIYEEAGALAGLIDALEHGQPLGHMPGPIVAKIAILAIVLAEVWPGRSCLALEALEARLAQKHVGASMVASYPREKPTADQPEQVRCDGLVMFYQCTRPMGHAGDHKRGVPQ